MFTETYGELCKGIDYRNIKSCNECNIGKKLNLCSEYEATERTPEQIEILKVDFEGLARCQGGVIREVTRLRIENKKLQQERDDAVKQYENTRYKILHMFEGEKSNENV